MIRALRRLGRHPVRALGSLRLTTGLLVAALIVILAGTLAQGVAGPGAARAGFFGSWIAFAGPLPLPGMRLVGVAAAVNLLFALVRRRRPRMRHAGLLVAHAGLVCMIAATFAAGPPHEQRFVMLREGATASTSFDPSSWDLRLEPAAAVVALERLREGESVPGAPSIVVERRFENSRPLVGPTGDALTSLAPLRPETDPADNRPGVILRVASPGGPVRSVVWAGRSTPLAHAGAVESARLARREQPLAAAITLNRLEVARYPGSQTLRSLAAHVTVDSGGSATGAMLGPNRPLRLGHDTVYLISQRADLQDAPVLVLGVRRNRSRIPLYVSAGLVVAGLALHVGLRLPVGAALLALCLLAPAASKARERPPLVELGRVPVLSGGRLMPLETYARLALRELSGSTRLGAEPAIGWMARLLFAPQSTLDEPVFVVRHRETLARAGLPSGSGGRLSFEQLEPAAGRLEELAARYSSRSGLKPFEEEIVGLTRRLALFTTMAASSDYARHHADFAVPAGDGAARLGLAPGRHSLLEIVEARERPGAMWREEPAARPLRGALTRWAADYRSVMPAIVPEGGESWTSAVAALAAGGEPAAAAALVVRAGDAFERRDWPAMRSALVDLQRASAVQAGARRARLVRLELLARRVRPFAVAMVLQGLALALVLVGSRRAAADKAAAAALLLGSVCLGGGLLLDGLIAARPPVATLAGTFVFVAWVLSLAGLIFRGALGARPAVGLGAAAGLLLAAAGRGIAAAGDPFAPLPVELDASLWLAAHVGTISLGYAAALAAAALGHLWLARRIMQPDDVATLGRLHAVLRALLRVALLLAAAGTLLGAVWADHAWGRFWDWDPKESGALFLVLWLATVLHASRVRLLRAEGTAAGAAAVVFPVAFSWLAANLMRAGLHSYGFVSGPAAVVPLAAACALEVLFLTACALLLRFRDPATAPPGQAPGSRWRPRQPPGGP